MVIKGHLFSRSTLGAKQSASLKRNFSDGNPMRGGSRLIYYLLCFSFSQTISTVFWRLCLPSGFQQLSWCTSTSGSFYLLYMCAIAFYVVNVFMCAFLPRVYMEAVKLESMHAPEHVMSSLVVAQVLI